MGRQDEHDDGGARARLGALVRQLIDQRGTSRHGLEARTGLDRRLISKAAAGATVPSENTARLLDEALDADGRIIRLREQAHAEKRAASLREQAAAVDGPDGDHDQADEEVGATDRRELFELGAAGLVAAGIFRRRSASGPDPLTIAELEDAVVVQAAALTTTSHDELAAEVYETWRAAEKHLDSSPKLRAQLRLTRVAGYASYTMGRLAFNLGKAAASRPFVTLAGTYGDELEDPILIGSVAALSSTLAFYSGRWSDAANAARRGGVSADRHHYVHARLAGYEARALAAAGDGEGARKALAVMRTAAVDVPTRPGCSPFGPASADLFAGGVLARLGSGDEAEPPARAAVEAFELGRAVGFEEHGHALLALAVALTSRAKPVPDEAANLMSRVVDMLDEHPTSSVVSKIGDVFAGLRTFAELAPVRELREQLAERPRLALASGTT